MLAVAGRWRMRLMMGRCHVLDWVSWTPSGQIGGPNLYDDNHMATSKGPWASQKLLAR